MLKGELLWLLLNLGIDVLCDAFSLMPANLNWIRSGLVPSSQSKGYYLSDASEAESLNTPLTFQNDVIHDITRIYGYRNAQRKGNVDILCTGDTTAWNRMASSLTPNYLGNIPPFDIPHLLFGKCSLNADSLVNWIMSKPRRVGYWELFLVDDNPHNPAIPAIFVTGGKKSWNFVESLNRDDFDEQRPDYKEARAIIRERHLNIFFKPFLSSEAFEERNEEIAELGLDIAEQSEELRSLKESVAEIQREVNILKLKKSNSNKSNK